jgi:uncharacterized radical SAM superfamily Fe-S cluster-containing enzyme
MTQAPAPRRKVDRDEVFVEFTKSICPICTTPVDAQVNIRENTRCSCETLPRAR